MTLIDLVLYQVNHERESLSKHVIIITGFLENIASNAALV